MSSVSTDAAPPPRAPTFAAALRFWWLLGWISFGGPAGQIAVMHRELVERRRWIDDGAFVQALGFCMLLPGPEAMQLATWLGWRLHGVAGGLVAGTLFVLPAALLLALLSWAYLAFGALPAMDGLVLGLSAVVLALLAQALSRLGATVLRGPLAPLLALAALAILWRWPTAFPWIVAGAAAVGAAAGRWRPRWLPTREAKAGACATRPPAGTRRASLRLALALLAAWWLPLLAVRAWLGGDSTAWTMATFFSQSSLLTFGGAYAVLPHVAQQAVEHYQWLSSGQMIAGLALAETTPGPLVIVLEYVGFVGAWQRPDLASPLASALLGAGVCVWATFVPSLLFVLPAAPWVEAIQRQPAIASALAGITAAVLGVIAHLAVWFGLHLFAGLAAADGAFVVLVGIAAWLALARPRTPVIAVVLLAALAGTGWRLLHG